MSTTLRRVTAYAALALIAVCAGVSHAGTIDHSRIRGALVADTRYTANSGGGELTVKVRRDPVIAMQLSWLNKFSDKDVRLFKECGINTVSIVLPLRTLTPEKVQETRRLVDLCKDNGFTVFWLTSPSPVYYDRWLPKDADVSVVDWQGKRDPKWHCMNNPLVKKAFAESMQECTAEMVKHGIRLDGVIMNEPGRVSGLFCYCDTCRKLFRERYGMEMPVPVNMDSGKSAVPVDWPSGVPQAKYIKEGDKDAWANMSEFYYTPMTGRINDIFRYLVAIYPNLSCQVTTITDINPYYGIDFWNGVLNNGYLDGIQTAIYWAVSRRSPAVVGDKGVGKKFVGTAQNRAISCYYWLQGYDVGDHSGPLRHGDIQIAVKEAFSLGVDGILIWSYLNPIKGDKEQPYDWDKYMVDLREAVAPYIKKQTADYCAITVNADGDEKSIYGDGTEGCGKNGVYRIRTTGTREGKVSLTISCPGCSPLQQTIGLDSAK